jgi:hypothetical protein
MELPSWIELVSLMCEVPDPEPTLRGAIRSFDGDDESRRHHAYGWQGGTSLPVFARHSAAGPPPYRVWRDGLRTRMERPDGSPTLIVGDELCWQFDRSDVDGGVVVSPSSSVRYGGHGTGLLGHRSADGLVGPHARRPLGPVEPTTFLGRPAWSVQVGPPSGKSFLSTWVIDAATGILLQDRNETLGSVDEWVELVVGDALDPDLFSWEGPAAPESEVREARDRKEQALLQDRRDWFAANVAPLPLTVELTVNVLPHVWDEETGAFEASVGEGSIGMLARRPRSDTAWELHWSGHVLRWSDDRWDWACYPYQDGISADGLEALKRQLGSVSRP